MKSFFCLLGMMGVCIAGYGQKDFAAQKGYLLQPHKLVTDSSRFHFELLKPLPQNYYAQHLGFFCKKEIKLEQKTGIPFRFRLGSVAYCDKLEGKTN